MVDDICDGGRTFIELAKELRGMGAEKVHLYVTHGFFTKGLSVFDGIIDVVDAVHYRAGVR
jgi:ribose-phosphate pyrophosphokinase